ncbi:alpha-L-fucosidase-like [Montipora foliosa]|uniref:alpha-L-fucosidase-like n=1 Tax=Montipora foliosa TaxID=591990 RepID=UPI0035F10710
MHRTSRIHPRHYGNDWSFSKPDVGRHIYHDKNSNSVNRKLNERRKSSKRDFVAILPPESFNLEGFDVEKVHDKGRGKVGGGKKHQRAREDKPIKQSHKKQHKGERKSTLMLRSRGSHYGSTTSKLDKKDMKHPRILLKNDQGNPQVQEKSTQRKKSHVKLLKHSPQEDQVPRKKNIVTSKSLRNHGMGKDGREQRAASRRRKDNKKKSMVKQSSKKRHRHRGQKEDVKETKHNQRKTRRKVSTRTTSSQRRHRKEDHERGSKKFEVHSHEKSTVRKRKKASKQNSTPFTYSASWNSLEKRKIPAWYDDAKFGIFVHWGVYSVPSFDNEWFWYNWKGRKLKKYLHYVEENYPPGFSYNNFAAQFKAEFFNATQWAKLVASSGARYFVFTSKHHEGFANWNSSVAWNWNSVDIGPHRNIVDELAKAIRRLTKPRVRFGLYYSLYEWFNPHYLFDKASGFKTDEYVKAVMRPQLYDLVNTYKPDYLWTDGEWEAKDTYWKSKEFLSWLYNESPVKDRVVVNDRWGKGLRCKHEVVCTGKDRYHPGKLQKKKWENAMTIDALSWGFRREANLNDFLSIQELIKQLVTTVSCGGNLLMNVGPASDGTISPIFQERLTQMGNWLKVNGDAIYKTRPWTSQNDSVSGDVWYTTKGKHVFAIALRWPRSGKMPLGDVKANHHTSVKLLGRKKDINWRYRIDRKGRKGGMVIHLPAIPVSDLPCRWAWVFKLSHLV